MKKMSIRTIKHIVTSRKRQIDPNNPKAFLKKRFIGPITGLDLVKAWTGLKKDVKPEYAQALLDVIFEKEDLPTATLPKNTVLLGQNTLEMFSMSRNPEATLMLMEQQIGAPIAKRPLRK